MAVTKDTPLNTLDHESRWQVLQMWMKSADDSHNGLALRTQKLETALDILKKNDLSNTQNEEKDTKAKLLQVLKTLEEINSRLDEFDKIKKTLVKKKTFLQAIFGG